MLMRVELRRVARAFHMRTTVYDATNWLSQDNDGCWRDSERTVPSFYDCGSAAELETECV
jgi:hypothetical protein